MKRKPIGHDLSKFTLNHSVFIGKKNRKLAGMEEDDHVRVVIYEGKIVVYPADVKLCSVCYEPTEGTEVCLACAREAIEQLELNFDEEE